MNLPKKQIKKFIPLLVISAAVSFGANAESQSITFSGYYEFQEHGLLEVGDPDYDKTILFPIFNTTIGDKANIHEEMTEVSRITGIQYSGVDKEIARIYKNVEASVTRDVDGFKKGALSYFNRTEYISDKTETGVALFSLKLNQKPIAKAFRSFDNLQSFATITLPEAYFDYPENDVRSWNKEDKSRPRFNASTAQKLRQVFNQSFGIDINSTQLLYCESDNELFAVQQVSQTLYRFSGINLNGGSKIEPFIIDKFKY